MSNDKIQLCDSNTKIQLCASNTKIQLCSVVPDSCPPGLDDEYDVTVCGVTVTVSRPEGNTDCDWTWTVGGETGCGINVDQVYLELNPGVAWEIRVSQGTAGIPEFFEYCDYEKTTGATPVNGYDFVEGTDGASCDSTATVSEST